MASHDPEHPGPQPSPDTPGPPPAVEPPVEHGWRLAITASACLISVFLDQSTSGATGAVSQYMTGSTGASADEGRWFTSAYLMPYFVTLLVTPWFIGRFGRRWCWTGGHLLYALACVGCALSSSSFGALVGWRFVQGAAQGTFFVCAVSTILTIFPPKIAFLGLAIFAGTSLSGAAAGPAVGGFFGDINAWTSLYIVFAALAVFAGVTVRFSAPDTAPVVPREPCDGFGIATLSGVSFFFLNVTQFGEQDDWLSSPLIVTELALMALCAIAFVVWEGGLARSPFLDLRLFARYHNLRWGSLLGFVLGVPLFGATTFDEYLRTSLGFSASLAGGELAVRVLTIVAAVPFIAYVLGKRLIDPRALIIPGFGLVALSYVLEYFRTTTTADFGAFVPAILFSGAGFALLFSPIASSILTVLPQTRFTRGVAIFKFLLVAGGTFATAALQIIVDHRQSVHEAELGSALSPGVPTFDQAVLDLGMGMSRAGAAFAPILTQQSVTLAFADSFLYTALLVVIVAPLALILKPPKKN